MELFLILGLFVSYLVFIVGILAFMMGASRKDKEWHEHK